MKFNRRTITENTHRALRRLERVPDALVWIDLFPGHTWDEEEFSGIPVYHGGLTFNPDNRDAPFIPIWKKESEDNVDDLYRFNRHYEE